MSLSGTDGYPPSSGIAIFGRFRTPSGRVSNIAVDAAQLAKRTLHGPAGQSLDELLTRAAELAVDHCPPRSRPIAIVGIGFGPPDAVWWKGGFDPDKHPRWPAGAPDSQGGNFRIREGGGEGGKLIREGVERAVRRVVVRRAIRTGLMATLRIGAKVLSSVVTGPIGDVLAVADLIHTAEEFHELAIDARAAKDFVDNGPYSLTNLRVGTGYESFPSHDAFVKDFPTIEEWLLKRFGRAGDGYEYHHIVEQGGDNAKNIPAEQLHNTDNIVSIPTLVHEAINAKMYDKVDAKVARTDMTYREWLPKQPYSVQRDAGIHIMRELGIIE